MYLQCWAKEIVIMFINLLLTNQKTNNFFNKFFYFRFEVPQMILKHRICQFSHNLAVRKEISSHPHLQKHFQVLI